MEWINWLAQPDISFGGLFLSSLLSATLLPGGSEAVLLAVAAIHRDHVPAALGMATLGNTLGGMLTYWMSMALPNGSIGKVPLHRLDQIRRWGSVSLVLAWLPLVGDVFCVAAGWLRLPWLPCLVWMAIGKAARYAAILWLAGFF